MKCACPWCEKESEDGCEAFFSGEPTCRKHDYRSILTDLADDTVENVEFETKKEE